LVVGNITHKMESIVGCCRSAGRVVVRLRQAVADTNLRVTGNYRIRMIQPVKSPLVMKTAFFSGPKPNIPTELALMSCVHSSMGPRLRGRLEGLRR